MSEWLPPEPEHPEEAVPTTGPAVGQDEWVAREGERRTSRAGWAGTVEQRLRRVPWWAWLTLFVAAGSLMPVFESSGYVRLVGFNTVIYMMLALGLNLVVGWGGLLDLGYIAFFGIGSYVYAIFDSGKFGYHVPSILIIPAAVIVGAFVGLLVGLPSRRLSGDYLAIVTLFFLELFETVATNGNQIFGHDITGGSFGISTVYPLSFAGHTLAVQHNGIFAVSYYYLAIVMFVIVYVALFFVNNSRTGRAWRSLREDPLAAEVMGMPVNWLKLMSFATGAGVAALAGAISTALNASVYPLNFSPVVLITIYAMVILGGSGSQPGVVIGAFLVSVLLQVLQDPGQARVLFYLVIVVGVIAAYRLSVRLAIVAASTAVFGIAAHTIAASFHHAWVNGAHGGLAGVLANWIVVPVQLTPWVGQVSYLLLLVGMLCATQLRGRLRLVALPPTLYLAAFVWENQMIPNPGPARYIVLGLLLIVLMIVRPNGLLGERRVEIN
jgi:branched-chain amino acid transport system permease protein